MCQHPSLWPCAAREGFGGWCPWTRSAIFGVLISATLTPSKAGSVKLGLGHASQKVSEKYYNLAQMVEAGLEYDETIGALRKAGRRARANHDL